MTDNLIHRLRCVKNRLQPLCTTLGVETYQQTLTIRSKFLEAGSLTPLVGYAPVTPNPKIYQVPERMLGLPLSEGSVQLVADDLVVDHVNREMPESLFREQVDCFIIGGTPPNFSDGKKYRLIHLDDRKSLGWRLILRQLHDRGH